MEKQKKIALLYGGTSSERDISIMSGKNVGAALENKGYEVVYIDPKEANDVMRLINEEFDLAYIALHGRGGEDGSIQGFLDTLHIRYTGSKLQASARAMNKAEAKLIYDDFGVPNAPYFKIRKNRPFNLDGLIKKTDDDVVVKAANEGSSIGLYFAKGKKEIEESINKAFDFDETVVVEKRIVGREFTVAVLEFPQHLIDQYNDTLIFDGNAAALPVIEIIPKNEYYDFASKYDEGGSTHICPAEIDESLTKQIQLIGIKAHKALGCTGFSRTDLRVNKQGEIFALETNTIPGMTRTSLVPDAARSVGIDFDELCDLIVRYELD